MQITKKIILFFLTINITCTYLWSQPPTDPALRPFDTPATLALRTGPSGQSGWDIKKMPSGEKLDVFPQIQPEILKKPEPSVEPSAKPAAELPTELPAEPDVEPAALINSEHPEGFRVAKSSRRAARVSDDKETKGLETLKYSQEDIGIQGNWRKKKDWLKQAIEENDSIQEIVAVVRKFSMKFQEKFIQTDEQIDIFYNESGLDKEKLDSFFTDVEKDIERTKQKTKKLFDAALSSLNEQIKEEAKKIKEHYVDAYGIEEKFKEQKNMLKQIKLDMKTIQNIDVSITKRLKTVSKQNETIQAESKRAQELSEKIWHVIDDAKAKDIFYKLKEINEKVKGIQHYVKVDLFNDFNAIIEKMKNQLKKTAVEIQKLEKEGLIIVNRAKRIEEGRKKQAELLKRKQETKQKITVKTKKTAADASWFARIKSLLSSIYEFVFM